MSSLVGFDSCDNSRVPKKKTQSLTVSSATQSVAFTDGSCIGSSENRQAGCCVFFGPNDLRNVSEKLSDEFAQTNNVAELMGLVRALEIISWQFRTQDEWVIYSDSKYAISCATVWAAKWQKNGWKKCNGEHVSNRHIIEQILSLLNYFPNNSLRLIYIPREQNKEADKLAKSAAMS